MFSLVLCAITLTVRDAHSLLSELTLSHKVIRFECPLVPVGSQNSFIARYIAKSGVLHVQSTCEKRLLASACSCDGILCEFEILRHKNVNKGSLYANNLK